MATRLLIALLLVPAALGGQTRPRAQDLGIPIGGTPGRYDAIADGYTAHALPVDRLLAALRSAGM